MTVMVMPLSEPLWLKQSVDEIDREPHSDEGGERIVKDHRCLLKAGRRRTRSPPTTRRSQGQQRLGSGPTWSAPLRSQFPTAQQIALPVEQVDVHQTLRNVFARRRAYVALIAIWFRDGSKGRDIRDLIKMRRHGRPLPTSLSVTTD